MKHIYLVMDGCYSDYHVKAAFSTREKAEAFIEWCREHEEFTDNPQVEEFGVDPSEAPILWNVAMEKDGTVRHVSRDPYWYQPGDYPWRHPQENWRRFRVYGRDEKQAVKAANERRAALISVEAWEKD